MKVGDLVRVDLLNPMGGEPRWQLGVIISFVDIELQPGCHIMLINGAKKWFPTQRLQVVK